MDSFCRMNATTDTLFNFYACDREEAEARAQEILNKYRTINK